jgi:hypothetical protein
MDPDATLAQLRATLTGQAAELFALLDEWLSQGGRLPADWNRSAVDEECE